MHGTLVAIAEHIEQAGIHLQAIQDVLGRDTGGGRVRFPRGYLKTVSNYLQRITWVQNETLKRNLCYHLIFGDVLRWLVNRTDIYAAAHSMTIKHAITVFGGVVEGLTIAAAARLGQPKGQFEPRTKRLAAAGAISPELVDELVWLWDARCNLHIDKVMSLEVDKYRGEDGNRAYTALKSLIEALDYHFSEPPDF